MIVELSIGGIEGKAERCRVEEERMDWVGLEYMMSFEVKLRNGEENDGVFLCNTVE